MRLAEAELFHENERTDRRTDITKLTVAFRNLAKVYKKEFNIRSNNVVKFLGPLLPFPGGPGSSVGIVTNYGLEGPGSNSGVDDIFRPSRLALGPTQSPENGYRVFPGGKMQPGRAAGHSPPSSAVVMEE